MIELVEDKLDIDTYLELRQSVNFNKGSGEKGT